MTQANNPRHNLPAEVTSFVGRAYALTEIRRLLGETRLLTLAGPGGSGKTRLALRAATESLAGFPEGVWLADLTTVSDPSLLPQAVASALGIRDQHGPALLAALADSVGSRRILLVLDNCEYLIDACASLAETLLAASANLRILATSREPMRAAGETVWAVPPLALPASGMPLSLALLEQVDAVRLFLDRAQARQPGFMLTPDHARVVVEICCRLDGLPLAIELAAAQTAALTVEQIAAHLDGMLGLLTGGRRSVARQATLRATIDWSHALLSEAERVLFRRLAMFAGGFDLAAAEAVCTADPLETAQVMPNLIRLVEKSLVVAETSRAETRYRLLESIRQYAMEQLQAAGELDTAKRSHAHHYTALAETAEPMLMSGQRGPWLDKLGADIDNLRAAWLWGNAAATKGTDTSTDSELGLRLAGAVLWFWFWDGRRSEGRQWAEAALAAAEGQAPGLSRAKALYTAGVLTWMLGDLGAARARLLASVELQRQSGGGPGLGHALMALDIATEPADGGPPRGELTAESEALFRTLGDGWGLAQAKRFAGLIALQRGDHPESTAQFEQSLALFRKIGDSWEAAHILIALGDVARNQGHGATAAGFYEECLGILSQNAPAGYSSRALHCFAPAATSEELPSALRPCPQFWER